MSTRKHDPILDTALSGIPSKFRSRIIDTYLSMKRNCAESRFEAAGLSTGKFCETVLRHLQHKVIGSYTPFGRKIPNFADECRRLIASQASSATESERVIVPRALVYLYTMRNKRGIGHIGGDVDPNRIDTAVMTRTSDWIVCELIRVNHALSLEEAQDLVDSISIRELPAVWDVAGKKRVLMDGLKASDQVLLLLYSSKETAVLVEDLRDWVEYYDLHAFRSRIVKVLHKARLIEHEQETDSVFLSPRGAQYVEKSIL